MPKKSTLTPVEPQSMNLPEVSVLETGAAQNAVIEVFAKTCERWKLDEEQRLILLGLKANEGIGWKALTSLWNKPSRDVEDRAGYVIGISLGLSVLFQENLEAELSWLREPRTKLNFKSAIDYMLEGGMINLIVVSETVKRERGI